jgi:SAM-dependent methyltransferase
MMKNPTIQYYDENAAKYAQSTLHVKISETLKDFSKSLPKSAKVLDVGCGSGRDSLYLKSQGFDVVAIDASAELAKFASEQIGQEVWVKNVLDLDFKDQFDGVWCMASLLHLKKEELPLAIQKGVEALKKEENGPFFACFKLGHGEGYDENGRFFSYYQPEELKAIFEQTQYFEKITITQNEDRLGRNEVTWINLMCQKKPALTLEKNKSNGFKMK